jgi:hypothetical protein
MFAQYFGQYLLNHNYVTKAELERAMIAQKGTRVKLGVLAINQGYVTPEQVETVQQMQMKIDKRFGEIAIELGFLSEGIVATLLSVQSSGHLALGQTLIDHGVMSYEVFAELLKQYKAQNSLSDAQFERIADGSIEALLEAVLLKEDLEERDALTDYISLFAKNMIRFIDGDIRLEIGSSNEFYEYDWVAQQPLVSKNRAISRITAIGGSKASFLQLASKYAQEQIDEAGEMMEDSVGEFLNLHNGIYLLNRSNNGTELSMSPQTVFDGKEFAPYPPIQTVIRVMGAKLQFDLLLSELNDLR